MRAERRKADPIHALLLKVKSNAKKKGIEFSVTSDQLAVPEFCPITGIKLSLNNKLQGDSYSIDRVDISKGYVPGNVRVVSARGNALKSNMTIEQVERLLAYMKGEDGGIESRL